MVFDFYDGRLFRMTVDYDRMQTINFTRVMTAEPVAALARTAASRAAVLDARGAPQRGPPEKGTNTSFGREGTRSNDDDKRNNTEYFFHQSACAGTRFDDLREGQAVSFTVGQGPKGPRAENVNGR